MTMFRGGFSNLLAPGYRKVVFETYKERPIEGTKLINMNTSKRAYEEDINLAGFGSLVPKVEGGPVTYQDPKQGTPKRYLWTTYALAFRITQEMMEDELYGMVGNKLSRSLGRSARNNKEIVMASVLNNAFDTAFVGFTAAESLISTTHTSLRGVVQANRPAVEADLSLPALQAALEHFHNLKDESGISAVFNPRWLVHGVSNYFLANQLLKTPLLPGGNMNDINQVQREGITPVLSHFLTDDDAWYLIADNHDMNFFERRPFMFSNTDDFETGDAKFKGTQRNGAGFGDWRGVYGSTGV
jgi:hypothetical protein